MTAGRDQSAMQSPVVEGFQEHIRTALPCPDREIPRQRPRSHHSDDMQQDETSSPHRANRRERKKERKKGIPSPEQREDPTARHFYKKKLRCFYLDKLKNWPSSWECRPGTHNRCGNQQNKRNLNELSLPLDEDFNPHIRPSCARTPARARLGGGAVGL